MVIDIWGNYHLFSCTKEHYIIPDSRAGAGEIGLGYPHVISTFCARERRKRRLEVPNDACGLDRTLGRSDDSIRWACENKFWQGWSETERTD